MFAATRLFITEKPDAARNLVAGICAALKVQEVDPGASRKVGYHRLSNGDAVLPLRGHMIEAVFLNPVQKDAKRDTYFTFLPVVVKQFTEYTPKPEIDRATGKPQLDKAGNQKPAFQYGVACEMIKRAKSIVNAGDVDREGQLIVDELLTHCGVDPEGRTKPIWRVPLVSAREQDIAKQVLDIREKNGDLKWVRRRLAALCRSLYDAGFGMNASMAWQAVTGYHRMAIGRMQTPVINIVVERDLVIENFVPRNYYVPVVTLQDGTAMRFFKREGCEGMPGFDETGRIVSEAVAKEMCAIIGRGLGGKITAAKSTKLSEAPPLPFSATVLASTVAKRTGMTPKQALAAAQSLYERHKAISYIGTDCQFLPTSLLDDVQSVMASLSRSYPKVASGASLDLRSRAWNDAKVDEHYAIVPTGTLPRGATPEEIAVYDTVAKRYMAQFYPAAEHVAHQLQALFGNDEFRASRRETVRQGWREVEGDLEQGGPESESAATDTDEDHDSPAHKPLRKDKQ